MKRLLIIPSILILVAIIWYSNPGEIAAHLANGNIFYILLALVISVVSLMLRALKWKILLPDSKYTTVFPIQIFGMALSNFTPGKLGEPTKAVLLKARNGNAVSTTLPTIIWERIFDVIILLFFSITALLLFGLNEFFVLGVGAMSIFLVVIVFFLVALRYQRLGYAAFRIAKKLPLLNRISKGFIDNFYRSHVETRKLILSFIVTVIPWILEGVLLYLAFLSIGIQSDPFLLASLIALAQLIALASFLPGGLGTFEVVILIMLSTFSIQGPAATAGLFLYRFVAFWLSAFIGGISFIYLSRKIDIRKLIKS